MKLNLSNKVLYVFLLLFISLPFQNCDKGFQTTSRPLTIEDSTLSQGHQDPNLVNEPVGDGPLKTVPPKSILFVGNSFTFYNNLYDIVQMLFIASGRSLEKGVNAFPDAYFRTHYEGSSLLEALQSGSYETVIFQGHSTEAENSVEMQEYGGLLIDLARSSGVKPVLFMTWNRKDRTSASFDTINSEYSRLGIDKKTPVAPVGVAWEIFKAKYPTTELYTDNRHPNKLGSYIAATTFYAFFTGESPVGLEYTFDLDPIDANRAQQAAWEAVQKFDQFY